MRLAPIPLLVGGLAVAAVPVLAASPLDGRRPQIEAGLTAARRLAGSTVDAATARRPWTDLGRTGAVPGIPLALPSRALTATAPDRAGPPPHRGGRIEAAATSPDRSGRPGRLETPQQILTEAAGRAGLDHGLVLAVSFWESGWDQSLVSGAGAVGLMQVEPASAAWAGPALLHRQVDVRNPVDNAEVGAALLKAYIDEFGDLTTALEAYNQGPTSIRQDGVGAGAQQYAQGIEALAQRIDAGHLPSAATGGW
ncbi:MAG: lytic transglycosylase domain-containing protein [Candidatus Dormibacteraceae bacterium]